MGLRDPFRMARASTPSLMLVDYIASKVGQLATHAVRCRESPGLRSGTSADSEIFDGRLPGNRVRGRNESVRLTASVVQTTMTNGLLESNAEGDT